MTFRMRRKVEIKIVIWPASIFCTTRGARSALSANLS